VSLKSGERLVLTDKQDITEANEGLLIFQGKGKPEYVRWDEVDEIRF
jgi:hypothetical protein